MKKIITTIALALLMTGLFAQNANTLRGSIGIGGAVPSAEGGGLGFDINLGWNIWDNLTAGVRYGGAVMIGGNAEAASAAANHHVLGTGTYFFNPGNSAFALFGGVGIGAYMMASVNVGGGASVEGGTVVGCMLTAGFEAGRFRLAVEYHIVADTPAPVAIGNIGPRNNNYLGISIGFTFGGGGRWGR